MRESKITTLPCHNLNHVPCQKRQHINKVFNTNFNQQSMDLCIPGSRKYFPVSAKLQGMCKSQMQGIRTISSIKLCSAQTIIHRFRACSEIPVFVKEDFHSVAANTLFTAPFLNTNESGTGIKSGSGPYGNPQQFQHAPAADYLTP